MNRMKLNLLAAIVVLLGAWVLGSPSAAIAHTPQKRACCESGEDQCCGDACRKTKDGCEACTGAACIFFFANDEKK